MANLISELLVFSRADLKTVTVTLESVDPRPVVVTAIQRESFPSANISVQIDTGIRVMASVALRTLALFNLVRNAAKKAVGTAPIRIAADKMGDAVAIIVRLKAAG